MDPISALENSKPPRSALACLPCRSRHVKCDGKKPNCSRCDAGAKQCLYARSRRGGLDRATLAERRKQRAAASQTALQQSAEQHRSQIVEIESSGSWSPLDASTSDGSASMASPAIQIYADNIANDPLIDSYYRNFHIFHPFLLPRKYLMRLYQDSSRQPSLRPLIAIIRLVGYIFSAREWSAPLKDYAESCFLQAPPTDPVLVQCRLIYSIALFWYDYKTDAKSEMDAAIRLALDLRMFRQEFAAEHGASDPVLKECWRRTWWMLYIVDEYYAGTLGTKKPELLDIEATVELPCEELEYEAGDIPEPRTLQEFDCREFAPDSTFSSFAYLVGAVQCAALAMSTAPRVAVKEDSMQVIQAADSILDGWLLLLPKDRKQVMTKTGEVDELMFQAHLLIHVATIGLHRPFSDLKFNPVEDVSSCARDPAPDIPTPELVNVHTVRVLRSVDAQIRLLALPVSEFHHTPFATCIISEATLALLSACCYLFKGVKLTVARAQIRMMIGCLKALGELWPRTARNVREIQTIAHHVLGLEPARNPNTPSSSQVRLSGDGQGTPGLGTGAWGDSIDMVPSLSSLEDLCGWYNLDNLDTDLSWEMSMGNN
ncbi:C6 zinc finger domain protein [Aspergillus sclerotiicarbonarius CBS 121057]|uniref:C6 zinc finger domain protein n=1 Tax=Aspergillus sclerotiicarbonarius (strain CBS 121057 / IBT 28362) TaxID=1448318 RepID=A0A319EE84_ASPSB|nr:C6 zinc finger domain protein [Aspergillus sclerotiicarbonarius CBS 121057]